MKILKEKVLAMPTREEALGGQRTKYVQQDEVVGLIESHVAVSENYIQQVATEMLVADLREAVAKASGDMQYATVIGILHLMIQEVTDEAKALLAP